MIEDELIKDELLSAEDPASGRKITLSPPPHATDYLRECDRKLDFPPRLGQHNAEIYGSDLGFSPDEMRRLQDEEII